MAGTSALVFTVRAVAHDAGDAGSPASDETPRETAVRASSTGGTVYASGAGPRYQGHEELVTQLDVGIATTGSFLGLGADQSL